MFAEDMEGMMIIASIYIGIGGLSTLMGYTTTGLILEEKSPYERAFGISWDIEREVEILLFV